MTARLYKVGDRVRIKTEAELLASGWVKDEYGGYTSAPGKESFAGGMFKYAGTVITLKELIEDRGCYRGSAGWRFTDEMIAGLAEETKEEVSSVDSESVTGVEQIISARITKTQETLVEKAKQYAKNGRLGNFYDIAEFNETTPEKAAMILLSKHFVALKDYVNQPEGVPMEQWEEKIGDIICYLHLLEAIIKVKK